jgi:uncharacterized membrane protein YfcA
VWLEVISFGILILGGFLAGNLSSLFGLGGGLVVVPLLYFFFHLQGINPSLEMRMAVGTSLVVMLVTTANVIVGRFRRKHIVFSLWKSMFFGVAFSALIGAVVGSYLSTVILKWVFVVFLCFVILQSFLKKGFSGNYTYENFELPPLFLRIVVSLVTGFLSVLVGVGGSVFTLPLFRHAKLPMEYASGTAVALTPAVAGVGALMYVAMGFYQTGLPSFSVGYLSLPAFVAVSLGSLAGVPVGLKLSHQLADNVKAKLYRYCLVIILISMLV